MASSLKDKKLILPLSFTNRPLIISMKVWNQLIKGSKASKMYNKGVNLGKIKKN